jgi:Protein of unknwon function (DUF3310)
MAEPVSDGSSLPKCDIVSHFDRGVRDRMSERPFQGDFWDGEMPDHDPVNRPEHYTSSLAKCATCAAPIECIQVTETMGFVLGNAVKYIWRADLKGGTEDLKKARWYLDHEIRRRERAAT